MGLKSEQSFYLVEQFWSLAGNGEDDAHSRGPGGGRTAGPRSHESQVAHDVLPCGSGPHRPSVLPQLGQSFKTLHLRTLAKSMQALLPALAQMQGVPSPL